MLAVFYGNDAIRARAAAQAYASNQSGDEPVTRIEAGEYQPGRLRAAAGEVPLFGGPAAYLIDAAIPDAVLREELEAALPALAESANRFVVIEGPLLAAAVKRYRPHAAEMQEYKKAAAARFNNFALADALLRRDKRALWLLLAEARRRGAADEEIVGILWWQLKTLRLSSLAPSAAAAGLADNSYQKAKRALPQFPAGELERLSHALIALVHDSRLGGSALDLALERWVLRL